MLLTDVIAKLTGETIVPKKPIYAKARPKRLGKPKSFNKKSKAYKSAKDKLTKSLERK